MRKITGLFFASAPAAAVLAAIACGSSTPSAIAPDAGPDVDAFTFDSPVLDQAIPLVDSSGDFCALYDGSDPVLLCTQQQALTYVVQFAYTKGTGVMSGYSSQAPYAATTTHTWQDDLGLAAAIASYQCSASYYNNVVNFPAFTAALTDLGTVLAAELPQAMAGYDGEVYFRLRNAALGYFQIMDMTTGAAMNAAADAYARNIQASFVHAVQEPSPPPDGGVDAGKRHKDAGAADAGDLDAGATTTLVIGSLDTGTGAVTYAPQQAIMAAAALLDMASRSIHGGDAGVVDGGMGTEAAAWEATAVATLGYVWSRGRDPVTGLFYQSLVTSSDPDHDALAPGGVPTSDALLTDVQGGVALGLARAQAASVGLLGDAGVGAASQYAVQADALAASMTSAGLFDGPTVGDGGTGAARPAAFLEGLVPSLSLTLTNKTTIGNALITAAFARAGALGTPSALSYERAGMRSAFAATQSTGAPWPVDSNLLSVVTDQLGDVTQLSYLRATSKGWGWAQAVSTSGQDAGLEADATTYQTAATTAMVEAFAQLWYGRTGSPQCSF